MSTRRDFGDERERHEWSTQERALRAELAGMNADADPAVAPYRLVVRALRAPRLDAIPDDFAVRTAARAAHQARIASDRVEVWLERGLVALLLVAGVAAVVLYRDEPLVDLTFSLPERAESGIQAVLSWSVAIAACVGLSSTLARLRKH
jgi:hypothetical protein